MSGAYISWLMRSHSFETKNLREVPFSRLVDSYSGITEHWWGHKSQFPSPARTAVSEWIKFRVWTFRSRIIKPDCSAMQSSSDWSIEVSSFSDWSTVRATPLVYSTVVFCEALLPWWAGWNTADEGCSPLLTCLAKRPFLRQYSVIYASFKTALIAVQYLV